MRYPVVIELARAGHPTAPSPDRARRRTQRDRVVESLVRRPARQGVEAKR